MYLLLGTIIFYNLNKRILILFDDIIASAGIRTRYILKLYEFE